MGAISSLRFALSVLYQGRNKAQSGSAKSANIMPSDSDLKNFTRLQQGQAFDATLKLVAELPPVPEDVRKRFPSMAQWQVALKDWHQKLVIALKGGP